MKKSTVLTGKISKKEFEEREEALRRELIALQQEKLRHSDTSVLIIIAGMDGSGKGQVINTLAKWLDPRGLEVHSYHRSSDEERERPHLWRFWRTMPAHGRIGVHFGAWYTPPLLERLQKNYSAKEFTTALEDIARQEQMLTNNGLIILKFWLYLSRSEQEHRLDLIRKDPHRHWKLAHIDWSDIEQYTEFSHLAQKLMDRTSTPSAPWYAIDAQDDEFRDLTIGETLVETLRKRLSDSDESTEKKVSLSDLPKQKKPLARADLSARLSEHDYQHQKKELEAQLHKLTWEASRKKISSILVFEGWDAGGKGGVIRRVVTSIDAQLYQVVPVAAPTDEEKRYHYLWRFWQHIPRDGNITIFDRSWYGRVLVERVEKYAKGNQWKRAYEEINDFEQQLTRHGSIVLKFWLHISAEEQLSRFKAREETERKNYKITDDDWRNRSKRPAYKRAVNEMIYRTDTPLAHWHVIAAEDKKMARITVMQKYCEALEKALEKKK
jgi:polyphosphate:AMP phosphotransferase